MSFKTENSDVLRKYFLEPAPVEVEAEEGVAFECPTATEIKVSGIDKQLVGQVAAKIRSLRKVEPYHEYGIKYKGERVVRKVGKAAGKGKK